MKLTRQLRNTSSLKVDTARSEVSALEVELSLKGAEMVSLEKKKKAAVKQVASARDALRAFLAEKESEGANVDDAAWHDCLSSEPDARDFDMSLKSDSESASVSGESNFSVFGLNYDCGSEGGGQARGFNNV